VVAGGDVGPWPVGGFVQHSGHDQDLDRWHLLGDLAAAVVQFVAVLVAGVGDGGDDGQQLDQLADLVCGEPVAVHDDPFSGASLTGVWAVPVTVAARHHVVGNANWPPVGVGQATPIVTVGFCLVAAIKTAGVSQDTEQL
jgi:hypothetical protein